MNNKRESGYYWVKLHDIHKPLIRFYDNISNTWSHYSHLVKDEHFKKIYPDRLIPPED